MFLKLRLRILRRKLRNDFRNAIHVNTYRGYDFQFSRVNLILNKALKNYILLVENVNTERETKFFTFGLTRKFLEMIEEQMIKKTDHWYNVKYPHIHVLNDPSDFAKFDPQNEMNFVHISILRNETIELISKFKKINEGNKKNWDEIYKY